ncbi:BQ2448_5499 [Microbotryum intermedium]|uniref:BQ2448_5499 protein n=1 Tax=Microbotryum intermedium TaxID=269621 RepID=A0A238F9M7_9BASI|nr:BQ2448_5499 [Microbotryum intermedium]
MDDPSSPRFAVQTAIRKHFGMAATTFMFARPESAQLDPAVERLFSKCVKLNFLVTKATKRSPISRHMYELVFESDQACLEAAAAGPFRFHGKEMVTELPNATPLNHIVQAVTASLGRAGCTQGYTVMQLQRGLATDSTDPMAMTKDGFHCAYLRLPADLFQGSAKVQKAALNAALPHEIEVLGAKYGLRHEFETHCCVLRDRVGHQWGTCKKQASTTMSGSAASVPGPSAAIPTAGFQVLGRKGKHGGAAALTSRASGTNTIQWGPRANPDDPADASQPTGNADKDEAGDEGDDAPPRRWPPRARSGGGGARFDFDVVLDFVRWHVGNIGDCDPDKSSTPGDSLIRLGTRQPRCHPGGIRHDPRFLRRQKFRGAVDQVKIICYLKAMRPAPAAILLQEHHLSFSASREGFESARQRRCIRFTSHVLTLIPDGSPLAGRLLSSTPVVFAEASRFDGRILCSVLRLEELDVEIINMYAPVKGENRLDFFELLHFNAPRPKTLRILAGDLSDYSDVSVDRVAINDRAWIPVSHWQTLLSRIAFTPLDTVRHVHPCTPAFTRPHYRGRKDQREICSCWANRLLSTSTLFDPPCSDHRPVVATFTLPTSNADAIPQPSLPSTSEFISRLNPTVFNDQDFLASIPEFVDEVYRRLEGTAPLGDVYNAALRAVAVAGHARYRSTRAEMRKLRAENQSVMEALEARGEHMNDAEHDAYAVAKSRLDELAVKEAQWLRIRAHVPSIDSREGQSASIRTRLNRRSR